MKIKPLEKYRLEIVVFLCGAIGMIIELVGSRVVSPYFGNSLIVWTSLIGVILGSLSAGYYFGGKIADKTQSYEVLGMLLLAAALLIGVSAFVKEPVMSFVSLLFGQELRSASFTAIFLLFGPASFILGIVAPYAARLKISHLESSGKVVGNLYALSTLGSISGTFLAGFYLIPAFGNTNILYAVSLFLILVSMLSISRVAKYHLLVGLLVFFLIYLNQGLGIFKLWLVSDTDSKYNRILVRLVNDPTGKRLVTMSTDNAGIQSALNIDAPEELYFEYTKAYAFSSSISPNIKKALMIGGGGYTFPRYFLKHNQSAQMDVIEIDSKMTELAGKYFFLKEEPRMAFFHQDARSFIRSTKNLYDVIFVDAFSSMTPPYHLTTGEFMKSLNEHLTPEGFLMINLVASVTGDKSSFLEAERRTLSGIFAKVDFFAVEKRDHSALQNLMVVAYKEKRDKYLSMGESVNELIGKSGRILSDDWAPVEFLTRNYYTR